MAIEFGKSKKNKTKVNNTSEVGITFGGNKKKAASYEDRLYSLAQGYNDAVKDYSSAIGSMDESTRKKASDTATDVYKQATELLKQADNLKSVWDSKDNERRKTNEETLQAVSEVKSKLGGSRYADSLENEASRDYNTYNEKTDAVKRVKSYSTDMMNRLKENDELMSQFSSEEEFNNAIRAYGYEQMSDEDLTKRLDELTTGENAKILEEDKQAETYNTGVIGWLTSGLKKAGQAGAHQAVTGGEGYQESAEAKSIKEESALIKSILDNRRYESNKERLRGLTEFDLSHRIANAQSNYDNLQQTWQHATANGGYVNGVQYGQELVDSLQTAQDELDVAKADLYDWRRLRASETEIPDDFNVSTANTEGLFKYGDESGYIDETDFRKLSEEEQKRFIYLYSEAKRTGNWEFIDAYKDVAKAQISNANALELADFVKNLPEWADYVALAPLALADPTTALASAIPTAGLHYAGKAITGSDAPISEAEAGVLLGLQSAFDSAVKAFASSSRNGDTFTYQRPAELASAYIAEDMGNVRKTVWDLMVNTGNQLPHMAVGAITKSKLSGLAVMGVQVYGSAFEEALGMGMSTTQAREYALIDTSLELGLEWVLGNMPGVRGVLSEQLGEKLAESAKTATAKVVLSYLGGAWGEFVEEGLQDVISPIVQNLLLNEDIDWSTEANVERIGDFLYSGLIGALSSMMMGGSVGMITDSAKYDSAIRKEGMGGYGKAKSLGSLLDAETNASKVIGNLNENSSAYDIGLAIRDAKMEISEATYDKIKSKLIADGFTEMDASIVASKAVKFANGQDITDAEKFVLQNNTHIANAIMEVLTGEETSAIRQAGEITQNMSFKEGLQNVRNVIDEGRLIKENIDNETATFDEGNAEQKAKREAYEIQKLKESNDVVSEETVAEFKNILDNSKSYIQTANDAKIAYRSGVLGLSETSARDMAHYISDENFKRMYNRGVIDAGTNKAVFKTRPAKGEVVYAEDVDTSNLSAEQDAQLKGIDILSKALGLRFVVHNQDTRENGYYKDGEVHVFLNAGKHSSGTMMFTVAHELTHFVENWNKDEYRKLREFVSNELTKKGYNFYDLVQQKQEFLSDMGVDSSFSAATAEVIADAMEDMLTDGEVIRNLAKTNKGLFNKIKAFIDDIVAKIETFLKRHNADIDNAGNLVQSLDSFKDIQAMWENALKGASQAYKNAKVSQMSNEQFTEHMAEQGVEVDTESGTAVMSWKTAYYNLSEEEIAKIAKELDERWHIGKDVAEKQIRDQLTLSNIFYSPLRERLDFRADDNSPLQFNAEYVFTIDFSNICRKRLLYTAMIDALQKANPNYVFTANDYAEVRRIMSVGKDGKNLEVACGLCYVEDRRQKLGDIAKSYQSAIQAVINGEKKFRFTDGKMVEISAKYAGDRRYVRDALELAAKDKYVPTIYELTTVNGMNELLEKHPNTYKAFESFNNARGQQAARLLQNEREYNGQLIEQFTKNGKIDTKKVQKFNDMGGLRFYSFSDFIEFHIQDILQIVQDCANLGLKVQFYTKVPQFAKLMADTGAKGNISLIPAGQTGIRNKTTRKLVTTEELKGIKDPSNYELAFDKVEGVDINDPLVKDLVKNKNLGFVLVGATDLQIRLAMQDDRISFIIPYHTNQALASRLLKGTGDWTNYKYYQTDKKKNANGNWANASHNINIYTEVIDRFNPQNVREFQEGFFKVCEEKGIRPRFYQFINQVKGKFTYTPGYEKMLVDYKLFDSKGNILPQQVIQANFDQAYMQEMVDKYAKTSGISFKEGRMEMDEAKSPLFRTLFNTMDESIKKDGRIFNDKGLSAAKIVDLARQKSEVQHSLKEASEEIANSNETVREEAEVYETDIMNSADIKHSMKYDPALIGKEVLVYNEGNQKPDLTLVKVFNERTGKTETTVKYIGDKPKNYVPSKVGRCYKLFEQHADGKLYPLFAGTANSIPLGEWVYAKGFPMTGMVAQMNLRERYGWHLSAGLPSAPHLMSSSDFTRGYPSKHSKGSKRVWVEMEFDASNDYNEVADKNLSNGDIFGLIPFGGYYAFKENNQSDWIISSGVRISKILTEEERQAILAEAGYSEEEAWRKRFRATEEEKAEKKRISAQNKKENDRMKKELGSRYVSERARAMRDDIKSKIYDYTETKHSLKEIEDEYDEAVKSGNEDWMAQMVSEYAYEKGYVTGAYHGSPVTDITEFKTRTEDDKKRDWQLLFGTHFTRVKPYAEIYTKKAKNSKGTGNLARTKGGKVYSVYLDLGKSLNLVEQKAHKPGSELYRLYEDVPANIKKKIATTARIAGIGEEVYNSMIEQALQMMTPKRATDFLVEHGYNSVEYEARYFNGMPGVYSKDNSIIMLDPERIKSADPITYDDNGNIIPLSERFNKDNPDIRYSMKDSSGKSLSPAQAEFFKDSKVRDKDGNLLVVYHGTQNGNFTVFNPSKSKSNFGKYKFGNNEVTYFTDSKTNAESYTNVDWQKGNGRLVTSYLNINNPYVVKAGEDGSPFGIVDKKLADFREKSFDRSWADLYASGDDYGVDKVNDILRQFNLEVRKEGKYFELWYLGNNSKYGSERLLYDERNLEDLFDDEHKEEAFDQVDRAFTTDTIVQTVLAMNDWDSDYDGVIIEGIVDSASMFSEKANDYIIFNSNQAKLTTNKNPTSNDDIRYSFKEVTEEEIAKAKSHFGTTKNFNEAGYLLKDGEMLDFSGRHWTSGNASYLNGSRTVDHRDIQEVLNRDENYAGMDDMIASGYIRLMPESYGISIGQMPTNQQISKLYDFFNKFNDDERSVDFSDENGNTIAEAVYSKSTAPSRIINDIKNFYKDGTIPESTADRNRYLYSYKGGRDVGETYTTLDGEKQTIGENGLPESINNGRVAFSMKDVTKNEINAKWLEEFAPIIQKIHRLHAWTSEDSVAMRKWLADNPNYDAIALLMEGKRDMAIRLIQSFDDAEALAEYNHFVGKLDRDIELIEVRGKLYRMPTIPKELTSARTQLTKIVNQQYRALLEGNADGEAITLNDRMSVETVYDLFNKLNGDKDLAELATRVFNKCKEHNVQFYGTNKLRLTANNPDTYGQYLGGRVRYSKQFFKSKGFTNQFKAQVILHEAIHSLTSPQMHMLERRPYSRTRTVEEDVSTVYARAKYRDELKGQYGTKSAREMLAEMANLDFRNALGKIELEIYNDYVRNELGLDELPQNAFERLKADLDYLIASGWSQSDFVEYESLAWRSGKMRDFYNLKSDARNYAPTFYSKLERTISAMPSGKLSTKYLANNWGKWGVKKDELLWSGVADYLEGKEYVTKDELKAVFDANRMQIKEVVKREDSRRQYDEAEVIGITDLLYSEFTNELGEGAIDYEELFYLMQDYARGYDEDDYVLEGDASYLYDSVVENGYDEDKVKELFMRVDAEGRKLSSGAKGVEYDNARYNLPSMNNYREFLFTMPNSNYQSPHWKELGVLVHTRTNDHKVGDDSALLVEEVQSDLHNDGYKMGYRKEGSVERFRTVRRNAEVSYKAVLDWLESNGVEEHYYPATLASNLVFSTNYGGVYDMLEEVGIDTKGLKPLVEKAIADEEMSKQTQEEAKGVTEAPFKDTYQDFAMKKMLRLAVEEGFDWITWTTAQQQIDRWSPKYEKAYRLEYDEQIPKFLDKFGKKFGTSVEKITLDNGETVWGMHITDSMRESVLYEGQPLFSLKETDAPTQRELLGTALATTAQSEDEKTLLNKYLAKVDKLNGYEVKLQELRNNKADILNQQEKYGADHKDIRRSKAYQDQMKAYDAQVAKIDAEIQKTIKSINNADGELLKLESMQPVRRLLNNAKAEQRRRTTALMKEREHRTSTRHKILKQIDNFNRMLTKPNKNKYVPAELVTSVVEFLESIDRTTGREQEKGLARLEQIALKYEALKKDETYSDAWDEGTAEMLKQLALTIPNKRLIDMTQEELDMVSDAFTQLNTVIKESRRMLATNIPGFDEDIAELANKLGQEIVSTKRMNLVQQFIRHYINKASNPRVVFSALGGFVNDSIAEKLYRMLEEGTERLNQYNHDVEQIFDPILKDKAMKKEIEAYGDADKLYTLPIKDSDGKEIKVTKGMMLSLYMHLLNEDNTRHLFLGGLTMPDMGRYYGKMKRTAYSDARNRYLGFTSELEELRKEQKSATEALEKAQSEQEVQSATERLEAVKQAYKGVVESQVMQMRAHLISEIDKMMTATDKAFIEAVQKYFEYSSKRLNEVSLAAYGFKKFEVQNYFPIIVDRNWLKTDIENFGRTMDQFSVENAGFAKDRVKSRKPMMLVDIVDQVARSKRMQGLYYGNMIPLRNFKKVYGRTADINGVRTPIRTAIDDVYHSNRDYMTDIIDHLLKNLNGQNAQNTLAWIRGKNALAALTLNPRVAGSQAASYINALPLLDARALGAGLTRAFKKTDTDLIDKYTKERWVRRTEANSMGEAEQKKLPLKYLTGWIESVDSWTINKLWYASEDYVKRHTDLKVGTDDYYKAVADKFNEVVRVSQPMYDTIHRPDVLRSENAFVRLLTMFYTQRLQNFSQIYESVGKSIRAEADFKEGKITESELKSARKNFRRNAVAVLGSAGALTAMKTAIDLAMHRFKGYRDDDDELTWESILGTTLKNYAESLASNLLFVSNLWEFVDKWVNDETYYGVSLGAADMIVDASKSLYNFFDSFRDAVKSGWDEKKSKTLLNRAYNLAKSICQFMGIPANNIHNIANFIYNWGYGIANGEVSEDRDFFKDIFGIK